MFAFILLANCANATVVVKPGERIQAAIDAAHPGETIEVSSGTYLESLVIDRSLILKGISSGGGPASRGIGKRPGHNHQGKRCYFGWLLG